MRYTDLKGFFIAYRFARKIAEAVLDWASFELWNNEAKKELAAVICMWQRAGAMI